ncbi:hypothetical protein TNCV_2912891 [Trichonephila clavipes]|nr:hypothetical protein TNCV_2912891 [Trichonephila clavipes]
MLSEPWLDNDERVSMPNFDCCVQFKRPGRRAAGVAIYHKQKNSHVVIPHMNITYRQTSGLGIISNDIRGHTTATAGSDVVQSGRPIFDDFFQHLWPYISNNTANVVFQMVKRLWLIRIDQ